MGGCRTCCGNRARSLKRSTNRRRIGARSLLTGHAMPRRWLRANRTTGRSTGHPKMESVRDRRQAAEAQRRARVLCLAAEQIESAAAALCVPAQRCSRSKVSVAIGTTALLRARRVICSPASAATRPATHAELKDSQDQARRWAERTSVCVPQFAD